MVPLRDIEATLRQLAAEQEGYAGQTSVSAEDDAHRKTAKRLMEAVEVVSALRAHERVAEVRVVHRAETTITR